jgi:hypothetical protein
LPPVSPRWLQTWYLVNRIRRNRYLRLIDPPLVQCFHAVEEIAMSSLHGFHQRVTFRSAIIVGVATVALSLSSTAGISAIMGSHSATGRAAAPEASVG